MSSHLIVAGIFKKAVKLLFQCDKREDLWSECTVNETNRETFTY